LLAGQQEPDPQHVGNVPLAQRLAQNPHSRSRRMDEGRKRVIGTMAAIMASLHICTADSPQNSSLIVNCAERGDKS